jgi:hypothetical protein
MGEKLFAVHIACNDPDNGSFIRKAQAINLSFSDSSCSIDLGMCGARDPSFDYSAGHMRLSRFKYRIRTFDTWVGNWCWNAYFLDALNATRLVVNLMADKRWGCEGGLVEACEAWDAKDHRAFMRIWVDDLWPPKKIPVLASRARPHPEGKG